MISHVHVGIGDFDRAFLFYAAVLDTLSLELKFKEPDKGWAGWMSPGVARALFLIGRPVDRHPASPGNGQMIALLAADLCAVGRCHEGALARGERSTCAARPRPHY